jgi:hypothetical protein
MVTEADPAQLDVAEKCIRQGISMAEEMKLRPFYTQGYLFLGELFEIAGGREEARKNLKKAKALYYEMGVNPQFSWPARVQKALARLELMPDEPPSGARG